MPRSPCTPLPPKGRIASAARIGEREPLRRHRLSVRTSPFQGGKTGSIPVGATRNGPYLQAFFDGCGETVAIQLPCRVKNALREALKPLAKTIDCFALRLRHKVRVGRERNAWRGMASMPAVVRTSTPATSNVVAAV